MIQTFDACNGPHPGERWRLPAPRFTHLGALGVLGALCFGVGPGKVDLAVKWISAHNGLRDLRKLDPATLGSRLLGGDGHDECEEAVLSAKYRVWVCVRK